MGLVRILVIRVTMILVIVRRRVMHVFFGTRLGELVGGLDVLSTEAGIERAANSM